MGTRRAYHGAAPVGGRIIVAGGAGVHNALATCEAYDPGADTWSLVASMRAPPRTSRRRATACQQFVS